MILTEQTYSQKADSLICRYNYENSVITSRNSHDKTRRKLNLD